MTETAQVDDQATMDARAQLDDPAAVVRFLRIFHPTLEVEQWACAVTTPRYGCNAFADTKAEAFAQMLETARELRRNAA